MLLGVHVSIAGKIYQALDRAEALGCTTMQIFSRSPREWRHTQLNPEDSDEFRRRRRKTRIGPVFIHVPYLTNLASSLKKLYNDSVKTYIEDVQEAGRLGAEYLVTHMGSHKGRGENAGLRRFQAAINTIIDETPKEGAILLLENTSGSGSWLGYTFEHHQRVIDAVKDKTRVGICLDTCHAYTAGYDIATEDGLEEALDEIDRLVGLECLKLLHLNDTKDKLFSHYDRHADIGSGLIGLEGFKRIVNHPKLKDRAFILETPKESEEDDIRNLTTVRKLRGISV